MMINNTTLLDVIKTEQKLNQAVLNVISEKTYLLFVRDNKKNYHSNI